jgi:hypothetical protein
MFYKFNLVIKFAIALNTLDLVKRFMKAIIFNLKGINNCSHFDNFLKKNIDQ